MSPHLITLIVMVVIIVALAALTPLHIHHHVVGVVGVTQLITTAQQVGPCMSVVKPASADTKAMLVAGPT